MASVVIPNALSSLNQNTVNDGNLLKETGNIPNGFIGFSNYPNQIHRKSRQNGFQLNLLVIGESGLGKMTFLKSLFPSPNGASAWQKRQKYKSGPSNDDKNSKKVLIDAYSLELEEKELQLQLNVSVVDHYSNSINNENKWDTIVSDIQDNLDHYFYEEHNIYREYKRKDNRYHACLYFIPPWSTKLAKADILTMKKISEIINLIPVIGKSDTLTTNELTTLKQTILSDLKQYQIKTFAPTFDNLDDDQTVMDIQNLRAAQPLAIVSCDRLTQTENEQMKRLRSYPWGQCVIETDDTNDFLKARHLIISSFAFDLIQSTKSLYESYRLRKLSQNHQLPLVGADLDQMKALISEKLVQFEKFKETTDSQMKEELAAKTREIESAKFQTLKNYEEQKSDLIFKIEQLKSRKQQLQVDLELQSFPQPSEREVISSLPDFIANFE